MSFTSLRFLVFLCATFLLYYSVPKKWRRYVLLAANVVFYLYAGLKFLPFLICTTVTIYCTGLILGNMIVKEKDCLTEHKESWSHEEKKAYRAQSKKRRRRALAIALIINFGILAFIKYFNFAADNLNKLLGALHIGALPKMELLLPLGISFYIFQAVGYIIDVFRGKYPPEKNFAKFSLFISFFPQMVQGPISRYQQLGDQLWEPHSFNFTSFKYGAELILWGFFKKLVIAERVSALANQVINNYQNYEGLSVFIGVAAYTLQLYADFSGGIDMARGVSQGLGIDLRENFERPFFSKTISEFWRRWNISLGDWFKDYLFMPLATSKPFAAWQMKLSRKKKLTLSKTLPTGVISLLTFTVLGVWHGPEWKYVAFGVYFGVIIMISRLLEPYYPIVIKKLRINSNCFSWRIFQILRTSFLVVIGMYFSRGQGLKNALKMLVSTFTVWNPAILFDGTLLTLGLDGKDLVAVIAGAFVLLAVSLLQRRKCVREILEGQNLVFRWIMLMGLIFAIIIFGKYGPGYDASTFIYERF